MESEQNGMVQAAQRGCAFSSGDTQDPPGCGLVQPTLGVPFHGDPLSGCWTR